MKFLYFFISLFCIFQSSIIMGSEFLIPDKLQLCRPGNAAAQKLFEIMKKKKTILGINIDTKSFQTVLYLLPFIAPHICLIKMCIEQYNGVSREDIAKLKLLAIQSDFMIVQDSKFADSSPTVKDRYTTEGLTTHGIVYWADFITIHLIEGIAILEYLKAAVSESNVQEPRGAFVITDAVDVLQPYYSDKALGTILQNDFVAGVTYVNKVPPVNKELIKLAAEEISLHDFIQNIQNNLVKLIQSKKTDICILKFSPDNNWQHIRPIMQQLQNFCWEEYKKLNS